MIRNRLAILLAERGIKITKASHDTGISRNSLTAIAQNSSEMIRVDTINTLCMYLNVTPNEFYEFIPIDTFFEIKNLHLDLEVSRQDSYETADYFKIDNLHGEIIFTIKSHYFIERFVLSFMTNNNIIFPLEISNDILRGIEVNVEFRDPSQHKSYNLLIGQNFTSNFFNQMNHTLIKEKIEEAIKNYLIDTYYKNFDFDSYIDEKYELAFKEYIFIRNIKSSFIKPF